MANQLIIENEPVFIIHQRPYSETSQILNLFTKNYGRVDVIAKGSKRPKSKFRSFMQPFMPLNASWSGRSQLKTLRNIEAFQQHQSLIEADHFLSALYMNELILNFLSNADPYPNLFDVRTGELRPDFDPSILQNNRMELKDPDGEADSEFMRNPFKGASWDKASAILENAKEKLQAWVSQRDPQNPTGREVLKALEYVQDQGVADYGDQITDLVQYALWADENDKELPRTVQNALQVIFDVEAFQKKVAGAVPSDKFPTSPQTVRTAKGDVEVPPELLPRFGQKGAPTIQQLTREQLMEIINWVRNNS